MDANLPGYSASTTYPPNRSPSPSTPARTTSESSVIAPTIRAEVGRQFSIPLQANPTSGYEWQMDYIPDCVRAVGGESEQTQTS